MISLRYINLWVRSSALSINLGSRPRTAAAPSVPPPEADDVGDGTSSTPNKWQGLCEIYWRNVAAFESVESFLSSKTKLKICEAF